jgi:competence protein ComFC
MTFLESVSTLLNPEFCINCGKLGKHLCTRCTYSLPLKTADYCIICDSLSNCGITHRVCSSNITPKMHLYSYEYKNLVRKIIIHSKSYQNSYSLLDILLNHQHNKKNIYEINETDIIIPAPMTKSFLSKRLTNHSRYIADFVGKLINKPVIDILTKNNRTPQKYLNKSERIFKNGKFSIKCKNIGIIYNKKILLTDDITTTGSTLISISELLIKNGAKSVSCYTLAKDIRYNI